MGDYYGLAGIAQLQNGAVNINQVLGAELDVAVQSGANVGYKQALSLAKVNADAVQGSTFDSALVFNDDATVTVAWKNLITIGRPDSKWPMDANSTIFTSVAPAIGTQVALRGIDFGNITFGDVAFRSPGFYVGPGGQVVTGGTPTAGYTWTSRNGSPGYFDWYDPIGTDIRLYNSIMGQDIFAIGEHGEISAPGLVTAPVSGAAHMYVLMVSERFIRMPHAGQVVVVEAVLMLLLQTHGQHCRRLQQA
jgi:hypothetical protein